MITITNLSMSYGRQILFEDVNLQLNKGARYGIVGANGSGKSTLLRFLTGEQDAPNGSVSTPKQARIGVLKQDHFEYEDVPILDVVMMGNPILWSAMQEKEKILAQAETFFDADRYGELEDIVLQHDGYSLESVAGAILEGLNIPTHKHRQNLSTLSGGYKLRVLLAQTLASTPDALLLDEPTNHLDIVSIRWLERFLIDFNGCVVSVSHDQRFLNTVCTHIIDIDYQRAQLYRGNFDSFERQKIEDRERFEKEINKREKEISDHKKFIQRFKAKATKARQAQSRIKRMAKIVIETLPISSRRYPKFSFIQRRPSGRSVVSVRDVSKRYGDEQVLDGVSFEVQRAERVAIIGPNGIGKSTLLKIMLGDVQPDSGSSEWGYETHVGYYAQNQKPRFSNQSVTLKDWLLARHPTQSIGSIHSRLGRALFTGDEADKKVLNLSGGEMARLVFTDISIGEPNVLVLDEPTNHLDIEGIEALSESLDKYEGTIIFVAHDRWFVSRVATRIIAITNRGITDYRGSYDEYIDHAGADHLDGH